MDSFAWLVLFLSLEDGFQRLTNDMTPFFDLQYTDTPCSIRRISISRISSFLDHSLFLYYDGFRSNRQRMCNIVDDPGGSYVIEDGI